MAIHSQYVTGRKVTILIQPHVYLHANILSVYSLCSHLPFEEITISLASAYSVTVLVVELVASLPEAGIFLATVLNPDVVISPASAYSLSTVET